MKTSRWRAPMRLPRGARDDARSDIRCPRVCRPGGTCDRPRRRPAEALSRQLPRSARERSRARARLPAGAKGAGVSLTDLSASSGEIVARLVHVMEIEHRIRMDIERARFGALESVRPRLITPPSLLLVRSVTNLAHWERTSAQPRNRAPEFLQCFGPGAGYMRDLPDAFGPR